MENCKNPEDTQAAGTGQRNQHGHDGVAHAAKRADHDIHDTADEVRDADIGHSNQAVRDNVRVGGIDSEKLRAEETGEISHQQSHRSDAAKAKKQNPVDPVCFAGAVVLTGEAEGGLMQRIHGGVDKALDVGGSSASGHGYGTEGVDGRLDQHIGNGKNRALHSGGKTDADHLAQAGRIDPQPAKVQPETAVAIDQCIYNQRGGNHLGKYSGQRNACDSHMKLCDKEEIEQHIDDACDKQEAERSLRIADGAQNGSTEVIEHDDRHSCKIDAHIERRLLEHVIRSSHQGQKRSCQKQAYQDEERAADQAGEHGGMNGFAHHIFFSGAVIIGHKHVGSDGQADEDVDQKVDQRTGGAHSGQRLMADKTAHYDDVSRIKQQLQDAGKHQRNCKQQDLAQQRSVTHVHFKRFFLCFHL